MVQRWGSRKDLDARYKPLGCLTKIIRIKNGFKNLGNVDINGGDLSKFTYADMKISVLIECRGTKMIGEIQCLLNWMLEAKKLGHTLYGFNRNREYMKQLSKLFYNNGNNDNNDNNNENREREIMSVVTNKNFEKLETLLLFASTSKLQQLKKSPLEKQLRNSKWKKGIDLYQSTLTRHASA